MKNKTDIFNTLSISIIFTFIFTFFIFIFTNQSKDFKNEQRMIEKNMYDTATLIRKYANNIYSKEVRTIDEQTLSTISGLCLNNIKMADKLNIDSPIIAQFKTECLNISQKSKTENITVYDLKDMYLSIKNKYDVAIAIENKKTIEEFQQLKNNE